MARAEIESFHPGMTFMSLPLRPSEVATRLIHEASHHRFLARSDARCGRGADDTIEETFAPLRIMHEHLGQTHAFTPAGKTLWPPVAERLFG